LGVSNPPTGMSELILFFQILFALPFAANDYVVEHGTGYGLVALVFGFLLAAGIAATVAYRKLRRTGI
jgi:hypothetical protein